MGMHVSIPIVVHRAASPPSGAVAAAAPRGPAVSSRPAEPPRGQRRERRLHVRLCLRRLRRLRLRRLRRLRRRRLRRLRRSAVRRRARPRRRVLRYPDHRSRGGRRGSGTPPRSHARADSDHAAAARSVADGSSAEVEARASRRPEACTQHQRPWIPSRALTHTRRRRSARGAGSPPTPRGHLWGEGGDGAVVSNFMRGERGARRPHAVISGHQRSSAVISGHQRSSAVISGHHRSSLVHRRPYRPTTARHQSQARTG